MLWHLYECEHYPPRHDPEPPDEAVVRIGEAAAFIGCSRQTLRNWCAQGILQAYAVSDVSGYRLFQVEDLIRARMIVTGKKKHAREAGARPVLDPSKRRRARPRRRASK